jgi:protein-S-isoprenylcysteine O-methyltransferase Ste14
MLVMPNLVLHYTINYDLPVSILDYIGLVISCVGLGICFISIVHFLSILKTLGLKVGKLSTAGSYQWSRNPQYLGWFIFLIGFALDDFSLWALAALIELAISLHLLVLIEEKHLLRSFGNQYTGFCKKVPRYIGLLKKDK